MNIFLQILHKVSSVDFRIQKKNVNLCTGSVRCFRLGNWRLAYLGQFPESIVLEFQIVSGSQPPVGIIVDLVIGAYFFNPLSWAIEVVNGNANAEVDFDDVAIGVMLILPAQWVSLKKR